MRNLVIVAGAVLLSGCANQMKAARKRHAAQFGCNVNELAAKQISHGVYLVYGCGPRATYICREGASVGICQLESVTQQGVTRTSTTAQEEEEEEEE